MTKLKLGLLLEESKAKEMEDINEVVRLKLEDNPKTSHKVQRNPYEAAYKTDLAIWQEYCDATERYEHAGICLKWPYYFHSHTKSKE